MSEGMTGSAGRVRRGAHRRPAGRAILPLVVLGILVAVVATALAPMTGLLSRASGVPVTYNPDYSCAVPYLNAGQSALIPNTGVTVSVTASTAVNNGGPATYLYQNDTKISTTMTFSPAVPAIRMVTRNHADAPGAGFETLTFTGTGGAFTAAVTNTNGAFTYDSGDEFTGMLSALGVAYTWDAGAAPTARGSYLDLYISCVGVAPTTQTVTGTTSNPVTATTAFTQTGFAGTMSYAVTSGTLPAGLTIDSTTGVISGTPTAPSSASVTVTATGSTFGTATSAVTFNVTGPALSTVTYDGNGATGGSVPVDPGAYASAASVTVLGNTGSLVKTGFTFGGWNTAANGSGTSYAPAASFAMGSSNVTLYAKWTAVTPPAPPAPGPPAPAATEAATTPETPAPVPSPTASPVLAIILHEDNASVPLGAGVAPGSSLLLVGGVPSQVRVVPDRPASPNGLDASGDGFTMRFRGLGAGGRPLGLAPDGALLLESSRTAEVSGSGFLPNAPVKVFLFGPARELGTVMTDERGEFSGRLPLPQDLPPGRYTLQTNGWTPGGQVRSLSLGVLARGVQSRRFGTASTVVYFPELSAELTDEAKGTLRGLVKGRKAQTLRTVVVGYVQADQRTDNNKYLSTMRAVQVQRYLESIGVKGLITTSGGGIAEQLGPTGRRAVVTIRYAK